MRSFSRVLSLAIMLAFGFSAFALTLEGTNILIDAGLKPGERFSGLLAYAHKLHLSGVDRETALKQTLAFAEKKK